MSSNQLKLKIVSFSLRDFLLPQSPHFTSEFERIASELLSQFHLFINSQIFALTEIEFYLTGPDHPDPFTHCDEIQKSCG